MDLAKICFSNMVYIGNLKLHAHSFQPRHSMRLQASHDGTISLQYLVMIHFAGHHVHFSEDVHLNTEIAIKMKGENIANVHLGFLQFKHKYEVQFVLPIAPDAKSLTPSKETGRVIVRDIKLCQGM